MNTQQTPLCKCKSYGLKNILIFVSICLFSNNFIYAATISGVITNIKNEQPIPYVFISLKGSTIGTYSNKLGNYILDNIPSGQYLLQASHISYEIYELSLSLPQQNDSLVISFKMSPKSILLEDINVVGGNDNQDLHSRDIRVGYVNRTSEQLSDVTVVAESDIFLSMLTLPGMVTTSDFSSGMYVRGGNLEQNLVLLDDIEIYNSTHFGNIFSAFNADVIDNVTLYKGGFPSRYAGRLSSVMDVKNREGDHIKHKGVARMSFISLSATSEGPWHINNQKGTYIGYFRRSYFELMQKAIQQIPDYYFYDGLAKLRWDLGQRDKIVLTAYTSYDDLNITADEYINKNLSTNWGNNAISIQYTHIYNANIQSQLIMSNSFFRSKLNEEFGKDIFTNKIEQQMLKYLVYYSPNKSHIYEIGMEVKHDNFYFKQDSKIEKDGENVIGFDISPCTLGFYLQDTWSLNSKWTVQPSIRSTSFLIPKNSKNHSVNYWRYSPSLSVRNTLNKDSILYISYGRYYQFINMISNDINSPFNIWTPIDESITPSVADHYVVGYKHKFSESILIDIEPYYKKMNNLMEYDRNMNSGDIEHAEEFDNVYLSGKGDAVGVDLLLQTQFGASDGYLGYSFCMSRRKYEQINVNPYTNKPEYFFPAYDRSSQLNIIQNINITDLVGWHIRENDILFGISYSYLTGQPSKIPEKMLFLGNTIELLYSYEDRVRLPSYSRLDLSLKVAFKSNTYTMEPYIQVINATNHRNIYYKRYYVDINEQYGVKVASKDYYQFPLMPFMGINVYW